MARDDILSKIKAAEADARAAVQRALEVNLVKSAEADANDYHVKSVAKAEADVQNKKESIIKSGSRNVDSMGGSASSKLDKAVEYLMKEFMGSLHA
jgi:V/A-type H+-transporting ATPase subunit G/H